MPKSLPKLIVSILVCQAAGLIGTIFTISAIPNWYEYLNLPSFRPPNILFGPVWTILYTLLGISLYWILNTKYTNKRREALKLFVFHMLLNASWSIIFFGFQQIFVALIVIVVMVVTLIMIMKKFLAIDMRASGILFPYLVWLCFATLLNFSIWLLNR